MWLKVKKKISRWYTHLNPDLVKKKWSLEEEEHLLSEYLIHQNKWKEICEAFPGRSANSVKDHFHSLLRRCFTRMCAFVGLTKCTEKMYNIRPATLAEIFIMASNKDFSEEEMKIYANELKNLSPKIIY